MSNKKIIISNLFLTVIFCILFLESRMYYEIPNVMGWKVNTKLYINTTTSLIRVKDEDSEQIIFYFTEKSLIYPEQIEKINEDEWRVTFKKRNK